MRRRTRSRCYLRIPNILSSVRREVIVLKNTGHGQLGLLVRENGNGVCVVNQGMRYAAIGQWNYTNDNTRFIPE